MKKTGDSKALSSYKRREITIATVVILVTAVMVLVFAVLHFHAENRGIAAAYWIFTVLFVAEIILYFKMVLFPLMKIEKKISEREDLLPPLEGDEKGVDFMRLYDKLEGILNNSNEQELREYSLEMNRRQAELMALQSQINPHFLYNTLDCIRGIALEEKINSIDEMTKALSDMFRYSVSNTQIKVQFRREIENIRNYLTIQQYRFNNSLGIMEDIDEDVYDLLVPKFIIQPIVENAVFHGLEPKREDRKLKISAKRTDRRFLIEIEDNGVGMDTDTVSSINGLLEMGTAVTKESKRTGIGITNVNERIRLLYGAEYGLRIRSCRNVGTQIVITIPAEES